MTLIDFMLFSVGFLILVFGGLYLVTALAIRIENTLHKHDEWLSEDEEW